MNFVGVTQTHQDQLKKFTIWCWPIGNDRECGSHSHITYLTIPFLNNYLDKIGVAFSHNWPPTQSSKKHSALFNPKPKKINIGLSGNKLMATGFEMHVVKSTLISFTREVQPIIKSITNKMLPTWTGPTTIWRKDNRIWLRKTYFST